jgi:hypothetical protein
VSRARVHGRDRSPLADVIRESHPRPGGTTGPVISGYRPITSLLMQSWDADAAERYDSSVRGMFAAELLDLTVGRR